MYKFECSSCKKHFVTNIINKRKCLYCGSTRVEKIGNESAEMPNMSDVAAAHNS